MSLYFYLEDNKTDESISKYVNLFQEYLIQKPNLKTSLYDMYILSKTTKEKAIDLTNDILDKCKKKVDENWSKINDKYPNISLEDAYIISSYTCESKDDNYSPYKIMNKNLVSEDRKKGLSIILKYLFIFLNSLRKLPKYYPKENNGYLYRCINKHINYKIDPFNPKVIPYIQGNKKTFWGFTSTSPNANISYKFLGEKDNIQKGTVFALCGDIWGYDITLFNYFNEEEILLEPERKFIVDNIMPPLNKIIYVTCKIENTPIILLENMEKEEIILELSNIFLIKEIADNNGPTQLLQLSDELKFIIETFKNKFNNYICYIPEKYPDDKRNKIKDILVSSNGSNIINFSKYLKPKHITHLKQLLEQSELIRFNDIKDKLTKYEKEIKLFEKDIILALKNSLFEFSVVSLVMIERDDYKKFIQEKNNCPNRIDRLFFHGINIESISYIIINMFKKARFSLKGEGVYFTDNLDYICYYGRNFIYTRQNMDKIPNKGQEFTMVASSTYYNKEHFLHVYDVFNNKYNPKKNEINFTCVDSASLMTLKEINPHKLYFHEYVINDFDQIFPYLGIKLRREEFCIIWRDNNFSDKPKYLFDGLNIINLYTNFNNYCCASTDEALKLVKRKKFNKIILISNIWKDYEVKKFIDEMRKIIGNDVIVLFYVDDIGQNLEWVAKYKNALITNELKDFESYIKCFSEDSISDITKRILQLKEQIEKKYNKTFNFTKDFLDFPNYKDNGNYSDLNLD